MRDPNRIYAFTKELVAFWSMYPDLRFPQVVNMIYEATGCYDPFYVEDNLFIAVLQKLIEDGRDKL